MKTGSKILILFLIFNLNSGIVSSQEVETTKKPTPEFDYSNMDEKDGMFPNPFGYVWDFGETIPNDVEIELENIIDVYEKKTSRQIVIVTLDSISPGKDIQLEAAEFRQKWRVGSVDKDNGLVILLCNSERKIGISTGTETMKVLTDEICKNVIDSIMIPEFRNNNFGLGINNGVQALIAKWN